MQTSDVTSEALQIIQRSLYCKDVGLYRHSMLTADIARHVATECRMFFDYSPDNAYVAGMLHDVGKLCIPGGILEKREPLSSHEWEVVRRHPVWGYEYVQGTVFEKYGDVILCHHEKTDGSGYPLAVKACDYSNDVRLISLVDQIAAFLENRPYRRRIMYFGLVCREIREAARNLFEGTAAVAVTASLKTFAMKWINDNRSQQHAFAVSKLIDIACVHPTLANGCGIGDCQLGDDMGSSGSILKLASSVAAIA